MNATQCHSSRMKSIKEENERAKRAILQTYFFHSRSARVFSSSFFFFLLENRLVFYVQYINTHCYRRFNRYTSIASKRLCIGFMNIEHWKQIHVKKHFAILFCYSFLFFSHSNSYVCFILSSASMLLFIDFAHHSM